MIKPNLIIIQLLHSKTHQTDFLRTCWENVTLEQKKDIFHFLYLSGNYKTFLNLLRIELNLQKSFVPWTHLFAILKAVNKLNDSVVMIAKKSKTSREEMARFRVAMDSLVTVWEEKKQDVQNAYIEKKKNLISALETAKQQGLKDQKLKIIAELNTFYPNDIDVANIQLVEKEQLARNTIHKVFQKKIVQSDWFSTAPDVDTKISQRLESRAKEYLKKNPKLALDIAIMFYQMDMFSESLKIIDDIEVKNSNHLWYALQIAIDGKQYASALNIIDSLKDGNLKNENFFSLLYYQAISLFGLGQKSEAKQILLNIAKIRPNFKSIDSLLIEWETH